MSILKKLFGNNNQENRHKEDTSTRAEGSLPEKMVFTWLNKQGVECNHGFMVQSIDRFTIEYREGPIVIPVYVEHGSLGGQTAIIIDREVFKRLHKTSQDFLPEEQERMLRNFCAAMEFQGLKVIL